jgi:hypothetical protein
MLFSASTEFEAVISPLNKAENESENADMNNRDSYLDLQT